MNGRKRIRLGDVILTNNESYSPKEEWAYVNYLDTGSITESSIVEIQRIDLNTEKLPSRARRKVKYYIFNCAAKSTTFWYHQRVA